MLRKLLGALVASVVLVGISFADEYTAKVKSVDTDKQTITFTVGDKEMTLPVSKDAEIYSVGRAKKGQPAPKVPVAGGLGGLKEAQDITVTTEKKDDKETVTAIKLPFMRKKKNDK